MGHPFSLGNNGDSTLRYGKSTGAIVFQVVPNHRFRWNSDTLIYNRPAYFAVAPNIDTLKQDRILHVCVAIDSGIRSHNRSFNASSGKNRTGTDDTVSLESTSGRKGTLPYIKKAPGIGVRVPGGLRTHVAPSSGSDWILLKGLRSQICLRTADLFHANSISF